MFEKYKIEKRKTEGDCDIWMIMKRSLIFWYKPLQYEYVIVNRDHTKTQKKNLTFRNYELALDELEKIIEKGEVQKKAVKLDFGASQTMWVMRS
jgi:hypothetical protein